MTQAVLQLQPFHENFNLSKCCWSRVTSTDQSVHKQLHKCVMVCVFVSVNVLHVSRLWGFICAFIWTNAIFLQLLMFAYWLHGHLGDIERKTFGYSTSAELLCRLVGQSNETSRDTTDPLEKLFPGTYRRKKTARDESQKRTRYLDFDTNSRERRQGWKTFFTALSSVMWSSFNSWPFIRWISAAVCSSRAEKERRGPICFTLADRCAMNLTLHVHTLCD